MLASCKVLQKLGYVDGTHRCGVGDTLLVLQLGVCQSDVADGTSVDGGECADHNPPVIPSRLPFAAGSSSELSL